MADMRISMMIELNAQRARAEAAALRAEIDQVGKTADAAGRASGSAAGGIDRLGASAQTAAANAATAGDAAKGWASAIDVIQQAINPLEAELAQNLTAMREITVAEEIGALTAREAALAHDQLMRSVTQLRGTIETANAGYDANGAAIARVETAMQRMIAANTGMTSSASESVAAELQRGAALDDLRARYDPLFAASRRYELELREIAEAERLGALSTASAAAARERMAQSLLAMPGQLNRVGAATRNTGMAVTQLGYQFNDIAMMIAAGQNPLVLALQQGSQITQVLGPMGAAGAVKSLGTALLGMLNPVNLVTYAAIAGGAAFIQWAMSGKEGAAEVKQGLRSVEEAIDQVKLKTLSIRFGEDNASVAKVIDEMAIISAQLDIINQKYRESDSLSTRQRLAEEAMLLKNQYAEAANLVAKYRESVAEQDRLAASIAQTRQTFASFFGMVPQLTGAIKEASDEAHRLATSGPSGGWLAGAISDAETLGSKLWDAASAVLWLDQNKAGGTADLARQYKSYGEGRVAGEQASKEAGDLYGGNYTDAQLGRAAAGSGGGGGAGAETSGVLALIAAQQRELAILREVDPVKQEMLRNSEALAKASLAERAAVETLIRTRVAEESALEKVRDAQNAIGETGKSLFVGLANQTMTWVDALDTVLSKLAEMAASSVWDMIWNGQGGSGGLGAVVTDWLGGSILAKADGGRISGPGGPRDDAIPAWVSNGEYIVNAAATANALPLLELINAGVPVDRLVAAIGGRGMAFADGGYVRVGSSAPAWARSADGNSSGQTSNNRPMQVQINNYGSDQIEAQQTTGPDGEEIIAITVGKQMSRGRFDKQQRARYGTTPQVARR